MAAGNVSLHILRAGTRRRVRGFVRMDERFTSPQSREFAAQFERIFFMARLGRVLRYQSVEVVRQQLPHKLRELLEKLERAERQGKWVER